MMIRNKLLSIIVMVLKLLFFLFQRSKILLVLIVILLQNNVFASFLIPNTKVEYVVDGDTFVITFDNKRESVRMKCIDAPEMKQTFIDLNGTQKNIGIEARKYLRQILLNSSIVSLKCSDGMDKYQRLTCEVFDENGNNINLQMVKDGYAYALPSRCFSEVDSMKYLGYQYLARFSQAGLWRYGVWDEPWRWRGKQNI